MKTSKCRVAYVKVDCNKLAIAIASKGYSTTSIMVAAKEYLPKTKTVSNGYISTVLSSPTGMMLAIVLEAIERCIEKDLSYLVLENGGCYHIDRPTTPEAEASEQLQIETRSASSTREVVFYPTNGELQYLKSRYARNKECYKDVISEGLKLLIQRDLKNGSFRI